MNYAIDTEISACLEAEGVASSIVFDHDDKDFYYYEGNCKQERIGIAAVVIKGNTSGSMGEIVVPVCIERIKNSIHRMNEYDVNVIFKEMDFHKSWLVIHDWSSTTLNIYKGLSDEETNEILEAVAEENKEAWKRIIWISPYREDPSNINYMILYGEEENEQNRNH